MFNSPAGSTYVFAALPACAGAAMVLFPGLFKKLQDAEYEDPLAGGLTPKFARMGSKAGFRLMGVGLLLVAGIIAYYAYKMP